MIDKAQIVREGEACEYLLALQQFKDYQAMLQRIYNQEVKNFTSLKESKSTTDAKHRGILHNMERVMGLPSTKVEQGRKEKDREKGKKT